MSDRTEIPRPLIYGVLLLACLMLVPPAVVARMRAAPSPNRRVHLIQDMDNQARFGAQKVNRLFADDRAMRPVIDGVVARSDTRELGTLETGLVGNEWSRTLPMEVPLNLETLRRGQDRFNIYCALCHGFAGFGDGIIDQRAQALVQNVGGPVNGTVWVQPTSFHVSTVIDQPVGQIFNTITHGIRNMAGYAAQIPPADRWAIAAYVKAIQASQNADAASLPEATRRRLGL